MPDADTHGLSRRIFLGGAIASGVGIAAAVPARAQTASARSGPGERSDAADASTVYVLTIDGRNTRWTDCRNLGHDIEVIEETVTDSSGRPVVTKSPDAARSSTLELRRPLVSFNSDIAIWMQDILDNGPAAERKTVALTVVSASGKPIARFQLSRAFPTRYRPDLGPDGELGERLDLAYDDWACVH